jgi:hypothetical protein
VAFIPNIPSSLGAISEFDKAITELLRHGAGELSSRIQLLIEDMVTRWLALDERIAAFDAEFASLAIGISTCVDVPETFSSDREEGILGVLIPCLNPAATACDPAPTTVAAVMRRRLRSCA